MTIFIKRYLSEVTVTAWSEHLTRHLRARWNECDKDVGRETEAGPSYQINRTLHYSKYDVILTDKWYQFFWPYVRSAHANLRIGQVEQASAAGPAALQPYLLPFTAYLRVLYEMLWSNTGHRIYWSPSDILLVIILWYFKIYINQLM